MNVFDFDGTIYDGDCTVDFFKFCAVKNKAILIIIPTLIIAFMRYKINSIDKTTLKEKFYSFLEKIPDIDAYIEEFWDLHIKKVRRWYLKIKRDDDLIISASPYFLIKEAANRLGIEYVLASSVNKHTGITEGKNCKGEEKVKRFIEIYGNIVPDNFYSDSHADDAMAKFSKKAFMVKGNIIKEWHY